MSELTKDSGVEARALQSEIGSQPERSVPTHSVSQESSHSTETRSIEGEDVSQSADPSEALALAVASALAPALTTIHESLTSFGDRISAYEEANQLLRARVEVLQQDQVRQLLKPAFERLSTLHAEATRLSESNVELNTTVSEDFSFFAESIEELLSLYDLDSVGAVVGGQFDSRIHHAQRAIETADAEQAGTIQRVMRQGFSFAGAPRVFLPARVTVYRHAVTSESLPEPVEEHELASAQHQTEVGEVPQEAQESAEHEPGPGPGSTEPDPSP